MAVINKSQALINIATFLADNSSEEISAKDVRDQLNDIVDSFLNETDFFTGASTDYVGGDGSLQPLPTITPISDVAYDATTWNGDTDGATKNAIRDKIETLFSQGGNSFTADAVLGTNDAFKLLFRAGNTNYGGLTELGKWMFGLTTPLADTDISMKGSGNTSATYGWQIQNSDNSHRASFRNDGLLYSTVQQSLQYTKTGTTGSASGYFSSDGANIQYGANRNPFDGAIDNAGLATAQIGMFVGSGNSLIRMYTTTSNGAAATEYFRLQGEGIFTFGGGGGTVANTDYTYYSRGNDRHSFWRDLSGNVIAEFLKNKNIGFGGSDYQGGLGVQFLANATTAPTGNPTGGSIEYISLGAKCFRQPGGENGLIQGTYQSKSATYTALPTDATIECTANTFTVTLYTAVGYKGRKITIDNSGAGTITVDGDGTETIHGALTYTLNPGEFVTLISNGTNWRING